MALLGKRAPQGLQESERALQGPLARLVRPGRQAKLALLGQAELVQPVLLARRGRLEQLVRQAKLDPQDHRAQRGQLVRQARLGLPVRRGQQALREPQGKLAQQAHRGLLGLRDRPVQPGHPALL